MESRRSFPLKNSHLYMCSIFMSPWCTVTESAIMNLRKQNSGEKGIVWPAKGFVTLSWLNFNFTVRPYPKPCWSLLKPSTTSGFPWMTLRKEHSGSRRVGWTWGWMSFAELWAKSVLYQSNLLRAHCEPKHRISHSIHQHASAVWTTPPRQRQN